jgi:hypothetical protein
MKFFDERTNENLIESNELLLKVKKEGSLA